MRRGYLKRGFSEEWTGNATKAVEGIKNGGM